MAKACATVLSSERGAKTSRTSTNTLSLNPGGFHVQVLLRAERSSMREMAAFRSPITGRECHSSGMMLP